MNEDDGGVTQPGVGLCRMMSRDPLSSGASESAKVWQTSPTPSFAIETLVEGGGRLGEGGGLGDGCDARAGAADAGGRGRGRGEEVAAASSGGEAGEEYEGTELSLVGMAAGVEAGAEDTDGEEDAYIVDELSLATASFLNGTRARALSGAAPPLNPEEIRAKAESWRANRVSRARESATEEVSVAGGRGGLRGRKERGLGWGIGMGHWDGMRVGWD